MTKEQPISAIETAKTFIYDIERELIGVFEYSGDALLSYYVVNGCNLEKSTSGGRSRIDFSENIALRYQGYNEGYTVNACARGMLARKPLPIKSMESHDGIISFHEVDPELLSKWIDKANG